MNVTEATWFYALDSSSIEWLVGIIGGVLMALCVLAGTLLTIRSGRQVAAEQRAQDARDARDQAQVDAFRAQLAGLQQGQAAMAGDLQRERDTNQRQGREITRLRRGLLDLADHTRELRLTVRQGGMHLPPMSEGVMNLMLEFTSEGTGDDHT